MAARMEIFSGNRWRDSAPCHFDRIGLFTGYVAEDMERGGKNAPSLRKHSPPRMASDGQLVTSSAIPRVLQRTDLNIAQLIAGSKPGLEYFALLLRDRTSRRSYNDKSFKIVIEYTAKQQPMFDQDFKKTIDKLLVLRRCQLFGPLRRYVEAQLLKLA